MTAFTAPAGRAAAGTSLAPAAPSSLGIAGRRPTPLVRATAQLCMTYRRSAPDALTGAGYRVGAAPPPRRYLTEDAQPAHANGYDNANHDLIVAVHDELVPKVGAPYRVRSLLGSGAFGQVFLCSRDPFGGGDGGIQGGVGWVDDDEEQVAVKVVRSELSYCTQSLQVQSHPLAWLAG
jgi:hypothetical protein